MSLTTVSSIAARFSKGPKRKWAYCGPPTYGTKFPNSSDKASKTSSSSSIDSKTIKIIIKVARVY